MNVNSLTIKAQEALQAAYTLAQQRGQQAIEPMHMLSVLVHDDDALCSFLLGRVGVNVRGLRDEADRAVGSLPQVTGGNGEQYFSQDASRVIQRAVDFTKTFGDKYASVEHLLLGLIAFGSMACEGTMFDWSGVYFETVIRPPKELIRLGYIAFMCTMACGRFTADRLVTRFGAIRVIRASGIVIATGLLLSVLFPHLTTATLGFLLVGFGTSSVVPLCYSLAGRSKTMLPGVALATVSTIGFFGFLLGPPVIGFIAHALNLRWSFALIALIGLTTTVAAPMLRQK